MIPPDGKRLVDYFGTEQLTESQKEAVAALQRFLEDPDERCFILRGYAWRPRNTVTTEQLALL